MRARGRHARGFTLIELMISLLVSSLLVGMILSIFTRMSTAYRTQQHVAELQQVLVSAQELIQRDLRQAGFAIPDGFRRPNRAASTSPGVLDWTEPAVQILDDVDGFGPDELRVYYGDPSAQAKVMGFTSSTVFTVDAVDRFLQDDLVVISNHQMHDRPPVYDVGEVDPAPGDPRPQVAHHRACIGRIDTIVGTTFSLDTTAPWGEAANTQCDFVRNAPAAALATTMIYRFAARAYRVDPDRRGLAVLQLSRSGGLVADDWEDLGAGFTDLQIASHWYENEDSGPRRGADTADLDTSSVRDWYSGPDQSVYTAAAQHPAATGYDTDVSLMTEIRVSLVVRTTRRIDTIGSARTPALIDPLRPDHNDTGNRASVLLEGVADAGRPEELQGDHLYRYATVGSDLRNLAVSR